MVIKPEVKTKYEAQHKKLKENLDAAYKTKEFKKLYRSDFRLKMFNKKQIVIYVNTDYFDFYGYLSNACIEAIDFELVPKELKQNDILSKKDLHKIYTKLIEQIHKDFLHTTRSIDEVNTHGLTFYKSKVDD